jgi:hypothetical protein
MAVRRNSVLRWIAHAATDENLDLYALAVAALAFTILGFVGTVSLAVLASGILGLLALLAMSQIRSRRQVSVIASAQEADPLALFKTAFPQEMASCWSSAGSFMFTGESMTRVVHDGRTNIRRILQGGGEVRVLLLDPDDQPLMRAADRIGEQLVESRIRGTLAELASLRESTQGRLEIRVCSFVPRFAASSFDRGKPSGTIFIQFYQQRPEGDSAPIFQLKARDGLWYEHFTDAMDRMWDDSTSWPSVPGRKLIRAARPSFTDTFGPELADCMAKSSELLITGVTRNALVNSHFGILEELLTHGKRIRFVLTDPVSDAVRIAADRYYAERSPDSVRERANHTLRLLAELAKNTGGDLSVRLSSHPVATGLIAVDSRSTTPESSLFVELYSYQLRGHDPRFILRPGEKHWFQHFATEAERIWDNAENYAFQSSS